ncbi:outer arm dynein light chain 1 [Lichtheimia hyalospora FSU 10163]|nr:outer arm dynein light chain 1 [Lichtheimia hyalospora FSU 10163]
MSLYRRNAGLHSLPTEITTLKRLSFLDLSHNRLTSLPSSIQQLKRLGHLNLAHNRISYIPKVIGKLRKLVHLDLSHNGLREVPLGSNELVYLKWLDVSHSRIDAIPAELLQLTKLTIKTEGCARLQRRASRFQHSLSHDAPSLVEICARRLVKQNDYATQPITVQQSLPMRVTNYLSQQKPCSFCGQPYFGSPVVRYRITLHNDGYYIPIKYQMCAAHWSDDTDRILAFFSQPSMAC